MVSLPTLSEIQSSQSGSQSPLGGALDILFEHSPILLTKLEPQLHTLLKSSPPLESYTQLIDTALEEISRWDTAAQAEFIAGHPRIGESKNLSKLSASEQGAQANQAATSSETLARLAHLNRLYEVKYPGLRYITFVNGRSRAVIAEELEDALQIPHSLTLDELDCTQIIPVDAMGQEWRDELVRAVWDVGRIAKSRLGALGVS